MEPEVIELSPPSQDGVRTFLVFLDLPKHLEFRVGGFPLLEVGAVVDFDLVIKGSGERKPREVKGPYRVKRRVLKYSTGRASRSGFSQWLELEPLEGVVPP